MSSSKASTSTAATMQQQHEARLAERAAAAVHSSNGPTKEAKGAKPKGAKTKTNKVKSEAASRNGRKSRKEQQIAELAALEQAVQEFKPAEGSVRNFADLPLSQATLAGLRAAYYTRLTDIQARALPPALKGRDVLGAARTGSGKTLAFLVPILEVLLRKKWGQLDGLGALVISPTRELAVQIFEVLRKIGGQHQFSAGLIIGGKNLRDEQERLGRMNILVATPGRLLQHMDQTIGFNADQLQLLVLDEADRILDMGFASSLNAILANLPKQRQTLLFSATQTKSVKDLARLSLKDPEYVAVRQAPADPSAATGEAAQEGGEKEDATEIPKKLEQHYMVVPLDEKLDVLWTFMKTHLFTKTIVFLSSGKQVRLVYENFRHMRPGVPLLHMHGKQKQTQRFDIYQRFVSAKHSILFATDVAARGLDFPAVDWVVQVDCPEDIDTYVHRVGRTARYQSKGRALLFLLPSEEEGMLRRFKERNITIDSIKPNKKKQMTVQPQLQSAAFQFPEIKFLAQRAFISYVRSIHLQKDKAVFKLDDLPLESFATSLGLAGAPHIKFSTKAEANARKNRSHQADELQPVAAAAPKAASSDEGSSDDSASDGASSSDEESESEPEEPTEGDAPAKGAVTKHDRMFGRKNQTVLSEHYGKLIHRDSGSDEEDDFLTLARKDHDLNERELPLSHNISKRKAKMGQSKKAMLSTRGNPTKVIFDDGGEGHGVYDLQDEQDFRESGQARELQDKFVEAEREALKQADLRDKQLAKDKRREKKRKRKANELGESGQQAELAPARDDDGYVSPDFDLPPLDDDERAPPSKKARKLAKEPSPPRGDDTADLEALALKALKRR